MATYKAQLNFDTGGYEPQPSPITKESETQYITFELYVNEPARDGYIFRAWQFADPTTGHVSYYRGLVGTDVEDGTLENPHTSITLWGIQDGCKQWTLEAYWEVDIDAPTDPSDPDEPDIPDENLVEYGYVLSFDLNVDTSAGASGAPNSIWVEENREKSSEGYVYLDCDIPSGEPTREDGYVFDGWNSASDGSGTSYKYGGGNYSEPLGYYTGYATESNRPTHVLYAQWTEGGSSESESGYVHIYKDGTWHKAIPHIYKDGTWHKATPYIYQGGKWHKSI